jgi:transposase
VIEASESGLEPALVRQYTSQIFDGLAYMHAMGIMHRLPPTSLVSALTLCPQRSQTSEPVGRKHRNQNRRLWSCSFFFCSQSSSQR